MVTKPRVPHASEAAWSRSGDAGDLAGLKDVDGLGELPGLPRAAAEFTQDAPGFELGVGAFARAA